MHKGKSDCTKTVITGLQAWKRAALIANKSQDYT